MKVIRKLWLSTFLIMGVLLIAMNGCKNDDDSSQLNTVKDIDGNVYKTKKIGNLVWFTENLRTTKYNDGTPIPTGLTDTQWGSLTTGAYSVYSEANYGGFITDDQFLAAYGLLYNGYAVNTGKLCPVGWRVPTDVDWTALTNFTGGQQLAGGNLKSTRSVPDAHPRWDSPNVGATDEYGFLALPGGWRIFDSGNFVYVGELGFWWSSTENSSTSSLQRYIINDSSDVFRQTADKRNGFSVRCVKNN